MRMDQWCSGVGGLSRLRAIIASGKSMSLPVEPTKTVMKADSHLQIDPSTQCVIDAKSAFDHLVRTAQELYVTRRSMQTLRTRCR